AGDPNDPNSPGEIVLNITCSSANGNTANFFIDCQITDHGTGKVAFIKNGPMNLRMRGHNTYSGGTYITQGRASLRGSDLGSANPDGFGSGPVFLLPGSQLYLASAPSIITNQLYLGGIGY